MFLGVGTRRKWSVAGLLAAAVAWSPAFGGDGVDLAPIAASLDDADRRTEILVIGDSITNPGKTDNLQTGFIRRWRPGHWRSWQPSIAHGGSSRFSFASTGAVEELAVLVPGHHQHAPDEVVLGGITSAVRWLHPRVDSPTYARLHESGIHPDAWNHGGFRDRDRRQRFGVEGWMKLHFEYFSLPAPAPVSWELASSPASSPVFGPTTSASDRADRWRLLSRSSLLEIPAGPTVFPLRGAWFHPDSSYPADTHLLARGIRFEDVTREGGLGISYVGYGGWAVENHAYPLADSRNGRRMQVDGDGNAVEPFRAGYDDEALKEVVSARRPNVYLVLLGANNASDDDMSMLVEMDDLLTRIRRVHRAAGRTTRDLDPRPRILLVSMFDLGPHSTMAELDRQWLRKWADHLAWLARRDSDVSFVDLHRMVARVHGPWESWEDELLSDGVHPNEQGADRFASLIWNAISESRCTADFDGDGFVDGRDLGRWLEELGPTDLPSIADIDGDGEVDGRDLGQVLLQWGTCEP